MSKIHKITFWIATGWLTLGMVSTGLVQVLQMKEEVEKTVHHLGYPAYFLTIIGIWKLLGAIAVLIPGFPVLKQWAYAGFFFLMSGAVFSHIAVHDPAIDFFGPTLLLVLTVTSWYLKPTAKASPIQE